LQEWTTELDDKKNKLNKLSLARIVPESMRHIVDYCDGLNPKTESTPQWVVEQYAWLLGKDLENSKNKELHIVSAVSRKIVDTAKEGLWVCNVQSRKRYVVYVGNAQCSNNDNVCRGRLNKHTHMLVHVLYEGRKMYCYTGVSKEDMSSTCRSLWDEIKDQFCRPHGKSWAFKDMLVQKVMLPHPLKSSSEIDETMYPIWCMFFMHCSVHKIPFCAITQAKKDLVDLRHALIWSVAVKRSSLGADNSSSQNGDDVELHSTTLSPVHEPPNTSEVRLTRSQATQLRSRSDIRRDLLWSTYRENYGESFDTTDSLFRTAAQYIEERIIGLPRPEYNGACVILAMSEWPNILISCQKSLFWTESKKVFYKSILNLCNEDTKVRVLYLLLL
jgi:hypothetical protein